MGSLCLCGLLGPYTHMMHVQSCFDSFSAFEAPTKKKASRPCFYDLSIYRSSDIVLRRISSIISTPIPFSYAGASHVESISSRFLCPREHKPSLPLTLARRRQIQVKGTGKASNLTDHLNHQIGAIYHILS